MSIHRRLMQFFSIIVIVTMFISGLPSSASAQGSEAIQRQVNAQAGKESLIDPVFISLQGSTGTMQDPDPTPTFLPTGTEVPTETPLPIETSIPTETLLPTETLESTPTVVPTEEPISTEEVSVPDTSPDTVTALAGATWYVATTGNNSNSCSTPSLPCLTINGALLKAASGDTIHVAIGTYTATYSDGVVISRSINLLGGWDAGFTSQTGYSTIDGQDSRRGITINNSPTVTISRFIIKRGNASGGGIKIWNSTVTLDNMQIFDNVGGGIFNGGMLTVSNSLIYRNKASQGAGLYVQSDSTTIINSSSIFSNSASFSGGGIGGSYYTSLTINNSTISKNISVDGGGIYINSAYWSTTALNHVTIVENYASEENGGIAGNFAIPLKNSILANNTTSSGSDENCGVSGVRIEGYSIFYPEACNFSGGTFPAIVDPQLGSFIPELGYYPLLSSSPAINKVNLATCTAVDQRGVSRPQGTKCDVGAYEYASPGPAVRLIILEGNNQRTAPTFPFPKVLKLVAIDNRGSLVPGVNITFTAPDTGASAKFASTSTNTSSVTTNKSGVATTSALVANNQIGTYTVSASASSTPGISFALENASWYVSPSGNDSNPCSSPNSPCATINGALNKPAFRAEDLIFVAKGTYQGSDIEVVTLDKSAILSGGWNESFTSRNGVSILDGQDERRGIRVTEGVIARLDYFVIVHGYSKGAWSMDGGGILNYGNLTLNFSSIHSNMAYGMGGGIHNEGTLALNNTTVSNNLTSEFGGGISNIAAARLFLNNTTISGNKASVYGSHGGGVYNLGTVKMQNSILANNIDSNKHPDCYGTGIFTSLGHNIIRSISGCTITPATGDKFKVNPVFGTFLPMQGYHPLQPNSPAVNAANSQSCYSSTDQRGVGRVGICDIGAYEFTAPASATSLLILDGNNQRVPPTFAFPKALSVVALDPQGSPVPGVNVTFMAPDAGASAVFATTGTNSAAMITNANGVASISLQANNQFGVYDISASADGMEPAVFSLENGAWYVAPSGNDSNSCFSPGSPCATIQNAIDKASKGDTILIALGVYGGGSWISISKSLTILGGWDESFTTEIGQSTIQGSVSIDNSYDSYQRINALIRGLTITGRTNASGLSNGGILTFENGSVINNHIGISNYGVLTLVNSTVSGNGFVGSIPSDGGGINNRNPGEANVPLAVSKIINSTITNNRGYSAGGIYNDSSAAGWVILQNSLVVGNFAASGRGSDCKGGNYDGKFTSLGYNIIGNIGAYNGAVYPCKGNWLATDWVGNQMAPIDPKIDALTDLGNNVWMHPLQLNSPAVDGVLSNRCPLADQRGLPRPKGAACDIGAYEMDMPTQMVSFKSGGAQDGWVLETSETSNKGGTLTLNPTSATFILGDEANKQQYRSILQFNTVSLPDNAVITRVMLQIKKQSITGKNPFATHGKITIDIRKGTFSNNAALKSTDFQAPASKSDIGLIANNSTTAGWYLSNLTSAAYSSINRTGVTQLRLRFQLDDDNDAVADFLRFYSGNATAANRPVLVIEYYVP